MDNFKEKQLKFKVFTESKRILSRVLILVFLVLLILSFWTSFQSFILVV